MPIERIVLRADLCFARGADGGGVIDTWRYQPLVVARLIGTKARPTHFVTSLERSERTAALRGGHLLRP